MSVSSERLGMRSTPPGFGSAPPRSSLELFRENRAGLYTNEPGAKTPKTGSRLDALLKERKNNRFGGFGFIETELSSSEEEESGHESSDETDSELSAGEREHLQGYGYLRHVRKPARNVSMTGNPSPIKPGYHEDVEAFLEAQVASGRKSTIASFHRNLSRIGSVSRPPRYEGEKEEGADIAGMLAELTLQQRKKETELVAAFNERNSVFWGAIEEKIRKVDVVAGERERKRKEEAERVRAEAEKREREERERREKEERERKEKEEREEQAKREKEERVKKEKEKEEKKKEEKEKEEKEKEEKEQKEKQVVKTPTPQELTKESQEPSSPSSSSYIFWFQTLKDIRATLPPVYADTNKKRLVNTVRRSVTPKIGQLTASSDVILRVISQIDEALTHVRSDQGVYTACTNHIAKALIRQATTETTARIDTCYPLGRLVVGLILRGHVLLGQVLMARLVKKCFLLSGEPVPPKAVLSVDDATYSKLLGIVPGETLPQLVTRFSGLAALYAAICESSPLEPPQSVPQPDVASVPDYLRPTALWRLAVLLVQNEALVKLEPAPEILFVLFQVAAPTLLTVFGRQWVKLARVILEDGIRQKKIAFNPKAAGSVVRLELYLESFESQGVFTELEGRVLGR